MTTTKKKPLPETSGRGIFTISVFPHVKKFMLKNFLHKAGVFRTEEFTILGKMVTLALRDNRSWKPGSTMDSYNDNYYRGRLTEKLTLELTKDQTRMSPRLHKLMRLNIDLDRVFKDSLIGWIAAQGATGIAAHPACKSFLEYYDLDPYGSEFSLDNAYKHWQRTQKGLDGDF